MTRESKKSRRTTTMAWHDFTPQLKKYINERLRDQDDPVIVTGMPVEGDEMPCILIATAYALYKVPRPIYQATFQTYLHREPPGPDEGFRINGSQPVDVNQQLRQWGEMLASCRNTAHLTPYLLEAYTKKGNRAKLLRLLWADPFTIWIDTDILTTVDVRWGDLKATENDKNPVYFQGTNAEAFFLPWNRWQKYERSDNPLLAQEAALARAWRERKMAAAQQDSG
jgi:hypothetical protein